jgi:hypothetical protein
MGEIERRWKAFFSARPEGNATPTTRDRSFYIDVELLGGADNKHPDRDI